MAGSWLDIQGNRPSLVGHCSSISKVPASAAGSLVWRKGQNLAFLKASQGLRYAILNLDLGIPYVLEDHAAHIWELTDGSRTVDDTCLELHEVYGGELETISVQVSSFLAELHSGKMIELANAAGSTKDQQN